MKNRKTFLLVLLLCGSFTASAQLKRFSIGPYVEAGFPVGDFSKTNNTGYGIGLNADIKLVAGFGVTGSVGYMRFGGKSENNIDYPNVAAVPVRIGLKYKLISILYVKAEAGAANYTGDLDGSAFLFAPGVGIRVLGLDVQAKWEGWFKNGTSSFFGLKAGYNF
ncbi:outer membrane beta-barrel protein [Chitinophaga rhizosphaerae]|uniref:outer membrane beta-barrel protein n=1 Tax=Chitinophaga rhizosphaerae TaxID=1864947 RepID=UPI000F813087|nr:outer membrane beta-barrel protein [Chitinophaga rhizosphaerae]